MLGEEWKEFEQQYLTETLKNDNHELGGDAKKEKYGDYDEEEDPFKSNLDVRTPSLAVCCNEKICLEIKQPHCEGNK